MVMRSMADPISCFARADDSIVAAFGTKEGQVQIFDISSLVSHCLYCFTLSFELGKELWKERKERGTVNLMAR